MVEATPSSVVKVPAVELLEGQRAKRSDIANETKLTAAYPSKAKPATIANIPNPTPRPYHTLQNCASRGALPSLKKKELRLVVEKRTWNGCTNRPLDDAEADAFDPGPDPGDDCP